MPLFGGNAPKNWGDRLALIGGGLKDVGSAFQGGQSNNLGMVEKSFADRAAQQAEQERQAKLQGMVQHGVGQLFGGGIAPQGGDGANMYGDAKAPGLRSLGNINLFNRPTVKNPDGSISTVRSMSIGTDQGEVLIPMVSDDGRMMTEDEAIAQYRNTGRNLGIFDTPDNATAYAESLHNDQAARYGDAQKPVNPYSIFANLQAQGVDVSPLMKIYEAANPQAKAPQVLQSDGNIFEYAPGTGLKTLHEAPKKAVEPKIIEAPDGIYMVDPATGQTRKLQSWQRFAPPRTSSGGGRVGKPSSAPPAGFVLD